jgi:molecular chaperone Hsp33
MENADIRGYLLQLNQTYADALAATDYPLPIRILLGEFLAASALLAENLKFKGRLLLQVKGLAEVTLLAAEASSERSLRCVARHQPLSNPANADFSSLLSAGTLVVTIEPEQGERYQSLVPLTAGTLAECLTFYFNQSDQLGTQIQLHSDGQTATGFLMQQLPAQIERDDKIRAEQWQHFSLLAATLTPDELKNLPEATLIRRLFAEDAVQLFTPKGYRFACTCSKARMANALIGLGESELEALFSQNATLDLNCEFCGQSYRLDRSSITELARGDAPAH